MSEEKLEYKDIYRSKIYESVIQEYFNIKDTKTRRTLLSFNEAGQITLLQSLANKLYSFIVEKIYSIDFGDIPTSHGDITKVPNYKKMVDCLDILDKILATYKQSKDSVLTVKLAMQNLIDKRPLFMKGYRINNEFVIVTYNTMVLSVVNAISLLITAHIEFIKLSDDKGYDIAFDTASKNKSDDSLMFNNLKNFNKMCQTKKFDDILKFSMAGAAEATLLKKEKPSLSPANESVVSIGTLLTTAGNYLASGGIAAAKTIASGIGYVAGAISNHPFIAGVVGIFAGFLLLIKIIRELIYKFYYYRTKTADWFEMQSMLIYVNALKNQSSLSKDEVQKQKWREAQEKASKWFKSIADKIRVDDNISEKSAKEDIKKMDEIKLNIDDVEMPKNDDFMVAEPAQVSSLF